MHKLIITILLLCIYTRTQACESCACSLHQTGLGIYPNIKKHFIGARLSYRTFNTNHPPTQYEPAKISKEYYTSAELWGRFNPHKRWQLFLMIPYQFHLQKLSEKSMQSYGMGDPTFLALFSVLEKKGNTSNILFQLGAGIKAPIGKYDSKVPFQNFQIGTQSWDFPLQLNVIYSKKEHGFLSDVSYRINTTNKMNYRYGNLLNLSLNYFYWWKHESFSLVPRLGSNYEFKKQDARSGALILGSDGHAAYANAGLDFFQKNIACSITYSLPFYTKLSNGYVKPQQKVLFGINYFF